MFKGAGAFWGNPDLLSNYNAGFIFDLSNEFSWYRDACLFWENPNSLLLVDLISLRIWISSIIRTLFPITRLSARDR